MNGWQEHRKRRFTWPLIIFMAAIISIAAFLGWIFMNGEAREKRRRALCMHWIKGHSLSMRLYAGDNDGWFPCDPDATTVGSFALMFSNYISAYSALICPSDMGVYIGSSQEPWSPRILSYAYNGFGLTDSVQADTPLIADRTSGDIRSVRPYDNNRWTHHTDGGVVLWADGHAAFTRTVDPPMYRGKNP